MNVWHRTLVVVLACVATTAAHADTAPPEWGGIWSIQVVTSDCATKALLFRTTVLDTICPNQPFPQPEGFNVTCTTTATTTTFTSHCEGSSEVLPGCTATIVSDLSGTRSGDTYTASGTISTTYTGSCFGMPNSCLNITQTATRIAPPPPTCTQTPVEEQSWGEVKSHYQ